MKFLVASLCLLLSVTLQAQSFPSQFIGAWQGTLRWYVMGSDSAKDVAMRFELFPTDTPNVYSYKVVYGAGGQDERPYILKKIDSVKNTWLIDERNGIVLTAHWVGNKLVSSFSIMKNVVVSEMFIINGDLCINFTSYSLSGSLKTGGLPPDIPGVESFKVKSIQTAVLKLQPHAIKK
jgi:hypothetical protein